MDEVHSLNGDFHSSGRVGVSETKPAGRPAGVFVGGSVSQSVSGCVCPKTFINSSGSAKPIRTGQTPKDAPEIGNDDSVGHVAPRVTCDPATCRHVKSMQKNCNMATAQTGGGREPKLSGQNGLGLT